MSVKDAANFRKAIKIYDKTKMIMEEDLLTIIETGLIAPSSNGLEPVKLIVIKDSQLKEKAAEACFLAGNQQKVKDAPVVMLLLGANKSYLTSTNFLESRIGRIYNDETLKQNVIGMQNYLNTFPSLDMFSDEQAHIMASFMSLQAADLKIGSSIMGGVTLKSAEEFFKENDIVDPTKWHITLGMTFGYYDDTIQGTSFPRLRIKKEDIVKIY